MNRDDYEWRAKERQLDRLIRQNCTEKFEGIPCNYPNCTCSPENRAKMVAKADKNFLSPTVQT